MGSKRSILLVEDHADLATSLTDNLEIHGFHVTSTPSAEKALELARSRRFRAIVSDVSLPGMSGLDLVETLRTEGILPPVIMITGVGTTQIAIEAMKLGAFEYLQKPVDINTLAKVLSQACEASPAKPTLVTEEPPVIIGPELVGNSTAMQTLYKEIGRLASMPVTVLIQGATGTGKELVARTIHANSNREQSCFEAVNCAAIPENLIESELFGHERGAFTGAIGQRIGSFERASGGTLFLDEIGELPLSMQAKLLRVLQEKQVQRVGGTESFAVDVRIIAATNVDLEGAVRAKLFREDLFFRINVATIRVPPLSERTEDIPLLIERFLERYRHDLNLPQVSVHPKATELLCEHSWPGNVRQLENIVRKAMILSRGFQIQPEIIRQALGDTTSTSPTPAPLAGLDLLASDLLEQAKAGTLKNVYDHFVEQVEQRLLLIGIRATHGNKSELARLLGLARMTLREKLKRHGLD